jgi:hypothetical protein
MPDPDLDFLAKVRRHVPVDADVANCWSFIVQGIEVGWLDRDQIVALIPFLSDGRDWGNEELLFAHSGDRVRVSFLDDYATCLPGEMAKELERLTALPPLSPRTTDMTDRLHLLECARRTVPADPDVRTCWDFVVEGIKVGSLTHCGIDKLVGLLRDGRDWTTDELVFEHLDDVLGVSFLDDYGECSSAGLANELEALLAATRMR